MDYVLAHAERTLTRPYLQPSTLQRFNLDVLHLLCSRHRLTVAPSGRRLLKTGELQHLKADYIKALVSYVSG